MTDSGEERRERIESGDGGRRGTQTLNERQKKMQKDAERRDRLKKKKRKG